MGRRCAHEGAQDVGGRVLLVLDADRVGAIARFRPWSSVPARFRQWSSVAGRRREGEVPRARFRPWGEVPSGDATRVSTTATFMATGGLIVSPTVLWIADDVGAIAYSVVYGDTPDPRDEVRLVLLAGAGPIVDSVQVAARRTPRYLNTMLRAVDLAYAGGSWWVAYLGADASGGDSTLSLREVARTGAGFDVRDHYVEASCDGSGECTELRDSNQSASVSGSGPTLIGASRLSAGPRTVLVGCP